MSVDIDWETLTGGPDGAALAETIREFVHERFQSIPLPNLIRTVTVHGFDFGKIQPEIVLKDIGDPLPDFYESDEDGSVNGPADAHQDSESFHAAFADRPPATRHVREADGPRLRQSELDILDRSGLYGLTRGTAPGVLGTTSNIGYFHLPLSGGLPGTQTPLAAVAGAHFPNNNGHTPATTFQHHPHQHADSFSSTSPTTPASSQGHGYLDPSSDSVIADDLDLPPHTLRRGHHESSPEDLQVVFHVTYAGDVRLSLTADVFLDYPMPSFVGIPLKLNITGLTFNGVGILAYIKKRAHLCFLNPEDAEALVGGEPTDDSLDGRTNPDDERGDAVEPRKVGTLLEDIKIESEMGETESGKQVLKNVGKIEKFILEQVQRIFEDEFVYPSFWTFLV